MENRIPRGSYFQYSPAGVHAPLQMSPSIPDRDRILAELLAERQKLGPFMQILPICTRLLDQEIMRISGFRNSQVAEPGRMRHEFPYRSINHQPNGNGVQVPWNTMQSDDDKLFQKIAPFRPTSLNWQAVSEITTNPIVKRIIRLDVPVKKYPEYNFVGRILGPRGNSLKRIEGVTQCRIFIRGQGSVKDSLKEETLKDKPGYEHLNEPLHLLVEAEFPEDIMEARLDHVIAILEELLKPMDESMDHYKKQQLRELALLNGTFREESPSMSPSMSPGMSPFNSNGMKRAKTGI